MRLLGPPKPYFSQSLRPDFLTNFTIPNNFREHLEGVNHDDDGGDDDKYYSEKIAKLRDKKGTTWDVKVDYESLNFGDGWERFCRDHDLQVGYFLVFRHQGNWGFQVLIFDHTATEREFFPVLNELRSKSILAGNSSCPSPTKEPSSVGHDAAQENVLKMGDEGNVTSKSTSFKPSDKPYFHVIMKQYCFNCGSIFMPMKFGKQNGLNKRWCNMVLVDEAGKSWPMKLRHMNTSRPNGGNPYITGGCSAFLQAHNKKAGDHLIFELIDAGEEPKLKVYSCEEISCRFVDIVETLKVKKAAQKPYKLTGGTRKKPLKQNKNSETNSVDTSEKASMEACLEEHKGKRKKSSKQKKNSVDTSEMARRDATPEDHRGKRRRLFKKSKLSETNFVDISEIVSTVTSTEDQGPIGH